MCLGNIPQGGCVAMAAGDKACDSSAGTPPAPDSGTAGHPATPTDTINTSGGGGMPPTVNYYNSSTVSGSSLQGTLGALAVRVIPSARVRRGRGLAAVLLAGLAILRTPPMEIVGHRGDVFDVGDAGVQLLWGLRELRRLHRDVLRRHSECAHRPGRDGYRGSMAGWDVRYR